MFADIVIEFENTTKFAILQYFQDYKDFMQNDYSYIYSYYNGDSDSVDASRITNLNTLLKNGRTLLQQFINFSNKLSNCGFWELQEYCQELYDTLEKITKLPKYLRTSVSVIGGYKPYTQINGSIGGMKTVEDLAQQINSPDIDEINLIINNDLSEDDWEIDSLSQIKAFVNNKKDVIVETILESPVGEKVYGKDINRKITFENNDLSVVEYTNNVEQKCAILLGLTVGDIPELPTLGKNMIKGAISNYNYSELLKDLQNVFYQDDLFDTVEVQKVSFEQGSIQITVNIKTKYKFETSKTLVL